MAEKHAEATEAPPSRVIARADYAVQVKEDTFAQPETYLVVRGDVVVGEFATAAEAASYVEENP